MPTVTNTQVLNILKLITYQHYVKFYPNLNLCSLYNSKDIYSSLEATEDELRNIFIEKSSSLGEKQTHSQWFTGCPCVRVAPLSICWWGIILYSWVPLQKMVHHLDRSQSGQSEKLGMQGYNVRLFVITFCFLSVHKVYWYYVLYWVFRTSLIEIHWGLEVKWTVRERLTAVWKEKKMNVHYLRRKTYWQSFQECNWFSFKPNHKPIKKSDYL